MKINFIVLLLTCMAFSINAQIPNTLSAVEKIYGLSKFWQEANYNFVYLSKLGKKAWDSSYTSMITRVQNTKNDYEYYRELQRFCALLKDGHTTVSFPQNRGIGLMTSSFGSYRLFTENINEKVIITKINAGKKEEIPIGSEIIEVNGKPTLQYIQENVAPYVASSTEYIREDISAQRLLDGLEGENYTVKIKKPDGKLIELSLTHQASPKENLYPDREVKQGLTEFKWLSTGLAYIALNSFDNEKIIAEFEQVLPELGKAKAIIIDLRNNGGGNSYTGKQILKYFTEKEILYGSKSRTRMHIAAYKAYGSYLTANDTVKGKTEWGMNKEETTRYYNMHQGNYYHEFEYSGDTLQTNAKKIIIPTAILTGHKTASAAEDFLIAADQIDHITKIGQRTYGSTGQPFQFELPGGSIGQVCTKQDTYPDGREFVGYGIKPDIEVTPTLNDYLQKKDPVIEAAIKHLKEKIK
ncbi:MAG: peptidase S41 [Chitinophagaceae bacterium]|nr:peptidase S41 [Chitinophagaceae bacterium]